MSNKKLLIISLLLATLPQLAFADDFRLTYKDGNFTPATLTIPAGEKVKLIVVNQDASPIEFESHELNREKVVSGNGEAVVFVGPLKAGSYPFVNEFNEKAKGTLVAK
ncbi:MAG: cupredoxin domain-containing protein [Rickettsiales bacterium]